MDFIIKSIKNNILRDTKFIYETFISSTRVDDYNIIIPNLYLGNYNAANDKDFINNMNLVINCSVDLPFPNFYSSINRKNFRHIRIPLNDTHNDIDQVLMTVNLPKICPIIHKYLNNGQKVFVHCYAGMQRSATIVLCYLMYKDVLENNSIKPLREYYRFLKSKRNIVFRPDPTFVDVIKNYYDVLKQYVDQHN